MALYGADAFVEDHGPGKTWSDKTPKPRFEIGRRLKFTISGIRCSSIFGHGNTWEEAFAEASKVMDSRKDVGGPNA